MHIVKVAWRVGHTHNAHYQGSKKAIAFVIDVLSGDAGCAGKGASHMDRRPIAAHFAWARTARGGGHGLMQALAPLSRMSDARLGLWEGMVRLRLLKPCFCFFSLGAGLWQIAWS